MSTSWWNQLNEGLYIWGRGKSFFWQNFCWNVYIYDASKSRMESYIGFVFIINKTKQSAWKKTEDNWTKEWYDLFQL